MGLPRVASYLSTSRHKMIPSLPNTFRALHLTNPEDCRVVIFGQDPYPREDSAMGVSFCDGRFRSWAEPSSPSVRNLFKSVLINANHLRTDSKVPELRQKMKEIEMINPYDWFFETGSQGVLWLNTVLTLSEEESLEVRERFWAPVIDSIFTAIIKSKQDLPENDTRRGVVFVLWGGTAKKLKSRIEKAKKGLNSTVPIYFVSAPHPSVESFHTVCTFKDIDDAMQKGNLGRIQWIIKGKDSGKKEVRDKAVSFGGRSKGKTAKE
ncbi:putative TKL protein kinase [Blattamonas nauphoetae]|uniref:TKL protein kinase n=1 Tax=Blattamonas nauphoetae TaxID=2049346 RepID=A0ABQ9YF24_9EUKA|nr:putative TKL protein kinase [Blattamonas nauphoetae]